MPMELRETEGNPVPDGAVVGSITSAGGIALRFAHWRAGVRRARGTVCIAQGRGESIERYFETVLALRERGFAAAAFDWRGQGGSQRMLRNARKGHVDSFSEYDADLATFMREVALPDCPPPYYALGHSTGALICLRAAHAGTAQFNRMVLTSPFLDFRPKRTPPAIFCRVSALMTAVGLGEVRAPGEAAEVLETIPFQDNRLTGDRDRFTRNLELVRAHPEISVAGPTFGWLYAACTAVREAADPAFAATIRMPTLMLTGGMERAVSLRAIEVLAKRLRGAGHITIKGGRHEILMERDVVREQFWAAFDAFVPGSA